MCTFVGSRLFGRSVLFLCTIPGASAGRRVYGVLRGDFDASARVNAGRAGSRAEMRAEAKLMAKELYKNCKKKET